MIIIPWRCLLFLAEAFDQPAKSRIAAMKRSP